MRTNAVQDVSFEIPAGKVLALAGESGSGKSTLARLLLGTLRRDSGSVSFMGRTIDDANPNDLEWIRKRCSFVQQDPYDSINPRMIVRDIISEPLQVYGIKDSKEQHERVLCVLSDVGLESNILNSFPHELSGGQRQRVALARALVLEPSLIITDEPVSMLDVSIRASILDLMRNLCDQRGVAFLYITHDLATAHHFCDDITIMYRGRLVEKGPIHKVLDSPRHPYTQALIDALPSPQINDAHKIRILDSDSIPTSGCAFRPRCPYAINDCKNTPKLDSNRGMWDVACFAPLD